ncbi:MFS transporter [Sphingosinithalassobacter portus]|uniref:MFS transporter n=1 Tax=Stakelama portus TaxID=2676234 RepID=UPI000D6E793B|nr:MFS transporter [Sphingosinithalassobacter portus]
MPVAGAASAANRGVRAPDDMHVPSESYFLLWAACVLGFFVDIGEVSIASALGAIFADRGGAAGGTAAISILLSATYVGAAIGAIGFGSLARRISTQRAIAVAMGLLGVASLAGAFAPNIELLIAARAVSGLGIGAYPPLAVALLATHLPARRRASLILAASAIGALGGPLMVYATHQLAEHPVGGLAGWRSALIAGAVAAGGVSLCFALLRGIDDARAGSGAASSQPAARPLPPPGHDRTAHIVLPALYVLVHWAGVGFPLLSGLILLGKGFELGDALLFVAAMMLGPPIGTLLSGLVVDRFARRDAVFVTLIVGAGALLAFGFSDTAWLLGMAAVLFGMAIGLYVPLMSLYAAEFFPRETRASATSRLWAMNRVSMAVAPLCLLPLLRSAGPLALMLFLAAILFFCAALILLAPAGHANEELA